ncbi:hypothetical protein GPA19_07930 [Azoarcus indigens]|uniref:Uncharacterized protein n=1 Tax=Azoarcus indigens TaxID=29545 RepID=A0A4R6DYI0_9RHOO|nr:hypothetical protein [Azoarcus indigens]NMG64872.1 hypothetical protein [Azoarcus indigens]TDN50410.1 hypothetical protein C7389_109104 [Azoarcus indigens]
MTPPGEWDGQEHRRAPPHTLAEAVDVIDQQLARRLDERLGSMEDLIRSGFPDGDPAGHCRYHEAEMARIEARAAFWSKLRFELAKWGLLGFLGWCVFALWRAALVGPK